MTMRFVDRKVCLLSIDDLSVLFIFKTKQTVGFVTQPWSAAFPRPRRGRGTRPLGNLFYLHRKFYAH
jgi:hypothetical protein